MSWARTQPNVFSQGLNPDRLIWSRVHYPLRPPSSTELQETGYKLGLVAFFLVFSGLPSLQDASQNNRIYQSTQQSKTRTKDNREEDNNVCELRTMFLTKFFTKSLNKKYVQLFCNMSIHRQRSGILQWVSGSVMIFEVSPHAM